MTCKVCDVPIVHPAGLNGEVLCHPCWDWAMMVLSGAPKVADRILRVRR